MTPHEKAVNAINHRLERLQANLREARTEAAQQFLFQSLVVTLGASETMSDYIKTVGQYAQRRHGDFKQTTSTDGARHAELLKSGQKLLEQLKTNPNDRALRQEIARAQQDMEAIQKELRRGAFALQRELALGVALIDKLSESIRRLCEADEAEALQRPLRELVSHTRELYAGLEPTRATKDIIDVTAWKASAVSTLEQPGDFYDIYARAGHQAMLALAVMLMAVSENPPRTAEEVAQRAQDAVAVRLKTITERLAAP